MARSNLVDMMMSKQNASPLVEGDVPINVEANEVIEDIHGNVGKVPPTDNQGNSTEHGSQNEFNQNGQGGVDYNANEGDFVYPSKLKGDNGKTYAKRKEEREAKIKIIENRIQRILATKSIPTPDKESEMFAHNAELNTLKRNLEKIKIEDYYDREQILSRRKEKEMSEMATNMDDAFARVLARWGGMAEKMKSYAGGGPVREYQDRGEVTDDFDLDAELTKMWEAGEYDLVNELVNSELEPITTRDDFNNYVVANHPKAAKNITQWTEKSLANAVDKDAINYRDYKKHYATLYPGRDVPTKSQYKDVKGGRKLHKQSKKEFQDLYRDEEGLKYSDYKKPEKPKKPRKPKESDYKWGSGAWKHNGEENYKNALAEYDNNIQDYDVKKEEYDAALLDYQDKIDQYDKSYEDHKTAYKDETFRAKQVDKKARLKERGKFDQVKPSRKDPKYRKEDGSFDKEAYTKDVSNWRQDRNVFRDNKRGKEPDPKNFRSQEEYQNALNEWNKKQEDLKKEDVKKQENLKDVDPNQEVDPSGEKTLEDILGEEPAGNIMGREAIERFGPLSNYFTDMARLETPWVPNFFEDISKRAEDTMDKNLRMFDANKERLWSDIELTGAAEADRIKGSTTAYGQTDSRLGNLYANVMKAKGDAGLKYDLSKYNFGDKLAQLQLKGDMLSAEGERYAHDYNQANTDNYWSSKGANLADDTANRLMLGRAMNDWDSARLQTMALNNYGNYDFTGDWKGTPCPGNTCPGCLDPNCVSDNPDKETIIKEKKNNLGAGCSEEQQTACAEKGEGWILDSNCQCIQITKTQNIVDPSGNRKNVILKSSRSIKPDHSGGYAHFTPGHFQEWARAQGLDLGQHGTLNDPRVGIDDKFGIDTHDIWEDSGLEYRNYMKTQINPSTGKLYTEDDLSQISGLSGGAYMDPKYSPAWPTYYNQPPGTRTTESTVATGDDMAVWNAADATQRRLMKEDPINYPQYQTDDYVLEERYGNLIRQSMMNGGTPRREEYAAGAIAAKALPLIMQYGPQIMQGLQGLKGMMNKGEEGEGKGGSNFLAKLLSKGGGGETFGTGLSNLLSGEGGNEGKTNIVSSFINPQNFSNIASMFSGMMPPMKGGGHPRYNMRGGGHTGKAPFTNEEFKEFLKNRNSKSKK